MRESDTKTNTKEIITREATNLFKQNPNKKITVANICAAANIKKSTFYYYFHSIDDVIGSIPDLLSGFLAASMMRILSFSTCFEQILEVFSCLEDEIIHIGVSVAAQRKAIQLKKKQEKSFPEKEAGYDLLITILKRAQETGELKEGQDIFQIAKGCFYIARGICETWLTQNGDFDLKNEVVMCIGLFAKQYFTV